MQREDNKDNLVEDSADKVEEKVVVLPKEIVERLKLSATDETILRVDEHKATIEVVDRKANNQNIALKWFVFPSVIASLVFLFVFGKQREVPLSGEFSIATLTLYLGLVTGICCFLYFFIKSKRNDFNTQLKYIYWRNFPTVVASFSVILAFVILYFFKFLDLIFEGLSLDLLTAGFIFFLFLCLINYTMIYFSLSINLTMLTNTLILVLVGGVLAAMITNGESQWWQHNFSYLGTTAANDNWQFNVTLIFSGFLMIALVDYLFVIIQNSVQKSRRLLILRIFLYLIALNLGAVGLFPNSDVPDVRQMHNDIANCLVALIIGLIIALRWLLPSIRKDFLRLSYFIGASLIASYILFKIAGYFSLTAFELIGFTLAFSWILLLLQQLQRLAQKSEESFEVVIKVLD